MHNGHLFVISRIELSLLKVIPAMWFHMGYINDDL